MSQIRHLHRRSEVNHTAQQIYALVSDVESYPKFLAWCVGARVLERRPDSVLATLEMSLAGIHRAITTQNVLDPPRRIVLELVEGPFSHFEGEWTFENLPGAAPRSRVSLEMSYALVSRWLAVTVGPVLGTVADSLVGAFCRRADALYGAPA
jgi:ribosome-associated toxin RatA of RatAB toxin-antitoxin module